MPSDQPIALPGGGTLGLSLARKRQVKALAMGAHSADLTRGNAGHQGMGFDILGDDGAGGDEAVLAQGDTAEDGRVGADARALFDQGAAVSILAIDR